MCYCHSSSDMPSLSHLTSHEQAQSDTMCLAAPPVPLYPLQQVRRLIPHYSAYGHVAGQAAAAWRLVHGLTPGPQRPHLLDVVIHMPQLLLPAGSTGYVADQPCAHSCCACG
jgi:hypothetical protein